MRDNN